MSIQSRMQKTLDNTKSSLTSIRTGRANPDLLSKVQVDYYGSHVPLQQVASISVPEPMMLQLNVFDKSAIQNVERAIMTSDLNLTPQTEGNVIRIRLPELTEQRRHDLVKVVKKHGEEGKVAIRNIRRDELDYLKEQEKEKEISEDEYKRESDVIQKVTDKYINQIDELIKHKEEEILKV